MLAKQCDVDKASYRHFVEYLNELADEGVLRREGPKRFKLEQKKQPNREAWNGVVTVNPRGFGFVAAAGKPDVFVPAVRCMAIR